MTKQLSEHFAARFKSCTAEQQLPLRNNLVKTLLRTMFFLAVMVIGTGSAWGALTNLTVGGEGQFHKWTSVEDNSTVVEDGDATCGEIHLNTDLNGYGALVYGTGSVWALHYARLTGQKCIYIEGSDNLELRFLFNRSTDQSNDYVEKIVKITNGSATLDLTQFESTYCHLNVIKVQSGSGQVTKLQVSDTYITSYNLNYSAAPSMASAYTNEAYSLPGASRSGMVLTGWFDAATGGTLIGYPIPEWSSEKNYTPTSSRVLYAHWANAESTEQIGDTEKKIEARRSFSPAKEIAYGKQQTFTFVNHAGGNMWNNWMLCLTSENKAKDYVYTNLDVTRYITTSSDGIYAHQESSKVYLKTVGGLEEVNTSDEKNTFLSDMQNANVTVNVNFSTAKDIIYIYATMVGNGKTYLYQYRFAMPSDLRPESIWASFTVDGAYLTDFDASAEPKQVYNVGTNLNGESANGGTVTITNADGMIITNQIGVTIPAAVGETYTWTCTGSGNVGFSDWGNNNYSNPRNITVDSGDKTPYAKFIEGYSVTFSPNYSGRGTVKAKVNGVEIVSGTYVPSGTEVTFTATANSGYKTWRWEIDGSVYYNTEQTITITKNTNATYNFTQGIKYNAYAHDGTYGSVTVTDGSQNGNTIVVNPWSGDVTFKATPKGGATLEGWYTNVDCTTPVVAIADKIVIDGNNVKYVSGYITTDGTTINLWAKFNAPPAFDPALDLNSTTHGSNATISNGVLTATGGTDNGVKVKEVFGHGNEYTGIRITTSGKPCRVIVYWGEAEVKEERCTKVIDGSEKATTSYYSWSMLGVPREQVANIKSIYFFGQEYGSYTAENPGITTFSNASLVNVTETTPYTCVVGDLREFNLNDTRVSLYNHREHYQMGDWSFDKDRQANIQWVYKSETNGKKFVTMKTTQTSNNMIEIFNSGHGIPTYDGIHIDFKGQHFRVIAYKGDEKHVYTVPASTDKITARFVTWADLGITDPAGLTRVEVAGCSDHSGEESVNFYGIRLYKSLRDIIYTDESVNEGSYNGNLAYRESHDGKDMSVVFKNIGGEYRAADCSGTIVRKGTDYGFTIEAPGCYNIKKVLVGLGENSTSTVLFNNNNVDVNNQNQIEWTNTATSSTVTMTIPSDAANVLHVKFVYYELEEIKIPSIEVNGQTRQYIVYAPVGITSSESSKVGVVISLHGASNDYYNGRVDFDAIANTEKNVEGKKFVVVYPRGLMRQLRGTERGWETYTESNTEDVEFFKAIVTELKKTYSVDMNRIYLAGFSNGGMMAYKAAHQAGDFFAAFASVGGYPVNESHLFHAGKQPAPFIHIQGKADGIFPNSTYPLDVITHNMVYRNGAKFNPWTEDTYEKQDGGMVTSPKDGEDNDIIDKDCHAALPGGAAFYMYKVAGMGHTWTYDWDGDHVDDVAATMWKFFNKDGIKNSIDQTLKFRFNDSGFWSQASGLGFDNVNTGTSVLSYGGRTKTDDKTDTFNKDSNNKNLWHSLQFQGGINGAAHFLKLNVQTENVGGASNEDKSNFFLVKLTRIDPNNNKDKEVVIFSKRYQAGRGQKDLYINFVALSGFNEYKLEITKSKTSFAVQINGMEVHTGKCQDVDQTENPTAFEDVATVLAGMNPIYQPVFENSYRGIAKEYLPIADIPVGSHSYTYHANTITYKTVEDNLKTNSDTPLESLPSTMIASTGWTTNDGVTTATITNKTFFSLATSGKTDEKTSHKSNNAVVLSDGTYTVDRTKGINISQLGRAEMPEYLNGTRLTFPTHGVIAIKVQGTVDFTLLAQNDITYPGDDANKGRSTLKVYYTNDQMAGELKELKEWWFYGVRTEGYVDDKKAYTDHPNGNNMNPLSVNVRLPQLGMDGTCTLFITYEGRRNNDHTFTHPDGTDPKVYDGVDDSDKIWIKGFVIKRPDLKVTIGRTDSKYSEKKYNGEDNTYCTRFGENKPYIWSFENVGFNNTKNENLNDKKVNVEDGRTYVCGGTDDSMDHLLLYSDITKIKDPGTGKLILDNKVQFDGRLAGQEHIEFLKPSVYNIPEATDNRCIFDPVQSNGLKVNVTGSGWFKIKCAAPNGKVKMKVYSSTNYGASYINLLREFEVDNSKHPESATGKEEHKWGEYTVYLKGHVNRIADKDKDKDQRRAQIGFWDGDLANSYDKNAEEILRMSLFVVFERMDGVAYKEDLTGPAAEPQLNIHQLSWLNEEPADYVFQREEDPKLLTTWQAIRRDGDGNKTLDDSTDANVVLYWKAGNDDDANYTVLKGHANGSYNVINQVNTDDAAKGVKSPGGYASTSVPSDAGTYDAYWDIAAPARVNALVEKAYGDNAKKTDTQYAYSSGNNTEFDTPVSGSFIRISAMQNTYVVAHVIPGNTSVDANATPHSGATVYVLDETGNPIPSTSSDEPASRLGYIAAMVNGGSAQYGGVASQDKTIRIDFVANAGKEYFICANGASISLARLEVHNWRNWTHKPTKAETLALTGNADNSSKIETAYETGNYYRDATLTRTFAAGKWASLVLPFSLNEQKFKEVFGQNAKCIHFTDVDTENNIVKLTHHYYNMIVAGRPVFIYTPDEVVNPQFKDITLQTKVVKNTTTTSGFTFHASYDGTEMKWNDLYMNNANAIKYVSNDKSKHLTYPGMRSFIQSPNEYDPSDGRAGSAGAKAVFLSFLNDDYQDIPTGIEELISAEFGEDVVVVTKTTKIYDLLGNVIGEGSDINRLPAGIYIVNGKKYIVK